MSAESQAVEFEVIGGCCRLEFEPCRSTGRDDDTNPGVGFTMFDPKRTHHGVIGRSDARRLRNMLDEFLAEHEDDGDPRTPEYGVGFEPD